MNRLRMKEKVSEKKLYVPSHYSHRHEQTAYGGGGQRRKNYFPSHYSHPHEQTANEGKGQ